MAVTRIVLPRKGIIQPKHGDNYEADLDTNWQIIDTSLQDAVDVLAAVVAAGSVALWLQDCALCGVISGLDLATSSNLTPGLSSGVLYAQGLRFALSTPNPGASPANATRYLFYNSLAGFYYSSTPSPTTAGDAFLGTIVTDSTHVTSVTPATKMYGQISVTAPAPGAFTLAHNLGRLPRGALIYMTSGGSLWFQSPTMFDATSFYLTASEAGLTANLQVW
jgi:hypothetical protein